MWARLSNNTVVEIVTFDPRSFVLNPETWKECDANTRPNATYFSANNSYVNPVIVEQEVVPVTPPKRKVVTPIEFKLMFTLTERLTMTAARAAPANSNASVLLVKSALDDWFSIIDDPRLNEIRLDGPTVTEGAQFLVQAGILTQQRANTIMEGI